METPPAISQATTPRAAGIAITSLVLGILSITCLSILAGIPALILGIVALNKVNKSAGTLTGKGLGIAGIVMGGVSFLLLPIVAALLLPIFAGVGGARDKAFEAKCMSNVKQIYMACYQYEADEGKLPKSLDEIVEKKFIPHNVLICPCQRGATSDYELLHGGEALASLRDTTTTIIIRETKANHHGKRAVGYADGRVMMESAR